MFTLWLLLFTFKFSSFNIQAMIIHTGFSMTKKTTTSINFEMDEKTNRAITSSAKSNGRSKRKEAAARLKDHVTKYGAEFTEK